MDKIVLVDDEKWILESLKGSVDWLAHGFVIAGEAHNGIEAFERILEIRPDAAFIDIRMPGMNGIELIRRLHEAGVPVQCIVASGYAEFEYARKAMEYGAAGYCLKPFQPDEIAQTLVTVKAKIARTRQQVQADLWHAVYGEEDVSAGTVRRLLAGGFGEDGRTGGGWLAVVVQGVEDPLSGAIVSGSGSGSIPLRIGRDKVAYLLEADDRAGTAERLRASMEPGIRGIGLSRTFSDWNRVRGAIDEANIASYAYFTSGERLAEAPEGDPDYPCGLDREAVRALDEGFRQRDAERIRSGFDRMSEKFRAGRYDIRNAYQLHHLVQSILLREESAAEGAERQMYDFDGLTAAYSSAGQMLEELRRMMMESFEDITDDGQPSEQKRGRDDMLPKIVRYVEERFREPLSVQEVSRLFFMHPNYLSFLFKREMKVNFTKYLTDIRMEHACKLLRETKLSVGEIAEQSGYGDYFYFAKLFKKHTGYTPSDYRQTDRE